MTRIRGSWFAVALVAAVLTGVVYLQAGAQAVPERQPLITEALVDAGNGTLTITILVGEVEGDIKVVPVCQ